LYLLTGNGHGDFSPPRIIELPGVLTAFVTGEINRADGIADVVVGVSTKEGARLLVFEGPNGALKAKPEELPMPGTVTALALGQLDNGHEMDLAVGAGEQLLVVYGRDRKLSLDDERQQQVLPARTETRVIGSAIKSLAIGDYANDQRPALALLTEDGQVEVIKPGRETAARHRPGAPLTSWPRHWLNQGRVVQADSLVRGKMSSGPGDDLIAIGGPENQLQFFSNTAKGDARQFILESSRPPGAAILMRLNGDALTDLVLLQAGRSAPEVIQAASAMTFIVNSTADTNDGQCTTAANGCTLREAINAANANAGVDNIKFSIPGSPPFTINVTAPPNSGAALPIINDTVTVDATTQPGFNGSPIVEINGANGSNNPVFRLDAGSCTIRGFVVNRAATFGILLNGSNGVTLEGNYLGTDLSGTVAIGNGEGVVLDSSSNNTIGGTTAAARNVISGNMSIGLAIARQSSVNLVQGNFIGTDITGTHALGNGGAGVQVSASSNNNIGGVIPGARNVISASQSGGIQFNNQDPGSTSNNLVQGNYIGTDVSGTAPLGGGSSGVILDSSNNNTIGGLVSAARNIISGNQNGGVVLNHQCSANIVEGNYIGTYVSGTHALGNGGTGVQVSASTTL
jgi:CSLREA domain-containing protein